MSSFSISSSNSNPVYNKLSNVATTVSTPSQSLTPITNGGVINGNLVISGSLKVGNSLYCSDNSVQVTAYTEQIDASFNNLLDRTQHISVANGGATIINQGLVTNNLVVTGSVSFPSNTIQMSDITGLVELDNTVSSFINGNNTRTSQIEASVTGQQTAISSMVSSVATVTGNVAEMEQLLNEKINTIEELVFDNNANKTLVTSHTANLGNLNTSVAGLATNMNTNNNLLVEHSDTLVALDVTTQTQAGLINANTINIADNTSNIQLLVSEKQNKIDVGHRLVAELIGDGLVSNTNFAHLEGLDRNIKTALDTLDSAVVTLNNLETVDISGLTSLRSDVTSLQNAITSTVSGMQNINNIVAEVVSSNNITHTIATETQTMLGDFQVVMTDNQAIINGLETTFSNINSSLSLLGSVDSSLQTAISNLSSTVTSLGTNKQTQLDEHSSQIGQLTTDVSSLETTDSNLQSQLDNHTSLLSGLATTVSSLQSTDTNLQSQLDNHTSSLTGLATTDTNLQSQLDIHTSSLTGLATTDTNLQSQLDNHNNLLTGIATDIQNMQNGDTGISTRVGTLETRADTLDTAVSNIQSQIDSSINTAVTSLTANIAVVSGDIATLQSVDTSINNSLASHSSQLTSLATSIQSIDNAKQNLITSSSKLPISNVSLGNSSLSYVDITAPLQAQLDTMGNSLSAHATSINTLATNIVTLEDADIIHSNGINGLVSDVTALQGNKQNLIDVSNLLSSALVSVAEDETLDARLVSIDGSINLKQNIIDGSNKLSVDFVDVSSSPLRFVNISSGLQEQLTSMNNSISTLTGLQNGDIQTFQQIQSNFDYIDTVLATKNSTISVSNRLEPELIGDGSVSSQQWNWLSTIDANVQSQINNLTSADNAIHSVSYGAGVTTIADTTKLYNLKFNDNTEQQTAFTSVKDTALSSVVSNVTALTSDVTELTSDLTSLTTVVSGKQDILNSTTNKLPVSNVDFTGSTLSNCDVNSSLNDIITGINSAISGLQSYDQQQSQLNTDIASDITELYGKQSAINGNNKISSLYVAYDTATVKDTLDGLFSYTATNDTNISTINSSLASQASSINTKMDIIDGNNNLSSAFVSYVNGSNVQNALDVLFTNDENHDIGLSNLVTSVYNHTINLDTLSNSITNLGTGINNSITGIETEITAINSAITTLQSSDTVQTGLIDDIQSNLSSLQVSKMDLIDLNNLLDASLVSVAVGEKLDDRLSSISATLDNLSANKMDTIDVTNKLPVSLVNIEASALSYVDINSGLQSQLDGLTNSISTLTTLQAGDVTAFNNVNTSISNLGSEKVSKSGDTMTGNLVFGSGAKIKYNTGTNGYILTSDASGNLTLQAPTGGGGVSYDSITYDSGTTTTTITGSTVVDNLKFSGDSSVQSVAFTDARATELTNATSNISSLGVTMDTKQNTIDSSHKLAVGSVDLTGSPLVYVDSGVTQNISTSLSAINSSLSALTTSDSSQTTAISTLSDSVSSLQTGKQDVINSSSRLDMLNIGTGAVTNTVLNYLSNVTGDIQTQINSKISAYSSSNLLDASNIGTGAVTNTVFNYLSGVTSSIQTQINSKASPYSGSNLLDCAYIGTGAVTNNVFNYLSGVTSSIQTQLTGKVDKTGSYMTGDLTMGFNTNNAGLAYQGVGAGYYLVSDATGRFMPTPPSSPQLTKVEGTISTANISANIVTTFGTINLGAGAWMLVINPYLEFQNTTASSISAGFTGGVPVLKNQYNQTEFWGQIQLMSITTIPANGYRCAGYSPILQLIYPDGDYTYTLTYTHYYSTNAGISCKWKSATNTMSSMFAIRLF